jgi:hypothetical protein
VGLEVSCGEGGVKRGRSSKSGRAQRGGVYIERGASKDGELVSIMVDIERDAMHALKERYGRNVPEINESGLSYKKIGFVWKHHFVDRNHDFGHGSREHPPSTLDESCITIPDNGGKGWRKRHDSKLAMCWWIVCNVPSASRRREWAEAKLGNRHSALLFQKTRLWCRIGRNDNGSITVEYNGRKMLMDEEEKVI